MAFLGSPHNCIGGTLEFLVQVAETTMHSFSIRYCQREIG